MLILERTDARERKGSTLIQKFHVLDASGINQAGNEVFEEPTPTEAMAEWEYGFAVTIDVKELATTEGSEGNVFEVTKTFTPRTPRDVDEDEENHGITWKLSMSMTTVKMQTGLDTIAASGSHEFEGNPIGVIMKDGKPETEGIDVYTPILRLEADVTCTTQQWRTIERRIENAIAEGVVNSNVFRGYQPGEVLLFDFSCTDVQDQEGKPMKQLHYTFDIQKTRNFTAGSFNIPNAEGWRVKWAYFGEDTDTNGKATPKCKGAYAVKVFNTMNFNQLLPN